MHTIKQIIENQQEFKEEILSFLKRDFSETLKKLNEMKTDDEEVSGNIALLRKKVSKMRTPSPNALFFMSKKRSKKYYAWWDIDSEEAIIHQYGQTKQ